MPRFLIRLPAATLALLTLLGTSAVLSMANAADCRSVRGALEETQVTEGCVSPVGLCTVARLIGQVKGQARFTAATITPTADFATTGVVFVSGDTTIVDARLGNKRGTVAIKNAAAFRTMGDGDLSDTQVIVGGTGDFTGVTGSLRVSGTFVAGSGVSNFEGTVCFP